MQISDRAGLAAAMGMACAALCGMPVPAEAGSQVTTGPFYADYQQTLARGGGCVSGTIGDAVPGNRRSTIYFLAEADVNKPRRSGSIAYVDGAGDADFLPGIATFTLCLKPGDYRIYGISTEILYSRELVNIPFHVVAGRHAYLGNFMFYGYAPNPDCPGTGRDIFVGFRDEYDRDLPRLVQNSEAAPLPLEKQLIDPAKGAPYFIACSSI